MLRLPTARLASTATSCSASWPPRHPDRPAGEWAWVASWHMSHVPAQEYYASLPKHIAGAGAIFHDTGGKVLLVKPSYRDSWEVPGGGLEHGEYPFQAAAREVKEETGLELRPGRLLAVELGPAAGRRQARARELPVRRRLAGRQPGPAGSPPARRRAYRLDAGRPAPVGQPAGPAHGTPGPGVRQRAGHRHHRLPVVRLAPHRHPGAPAACREQFS